MGRSMMRVHAHQGHNRRNYFFKSLVWDRAFLISFLETYLLLHVEGGSGRIVRLNFRNISMNLNYLPFEQPIAELNEKIAELKRVGTGSNINLNDEIGRLSKKCDSLTKDIFSSLTAQQIVMLARHPMRPHTVDYIDLIFNDFDELHGDRHSDQAKSMTAGLAFIDEHPVVVIGHEKGRTTKEKVEHNFGMATPEGFRKALRVMKLAEKFNLPIISLIDTPGAYPGVTAEEHNQSEAIARNLYEMAQLKTPVICVVTGEGCSGGALGIGLGDYTMMLQYSYYSVISPEGCASILWKDAGKAGDAAEALNLKADQLLKLGLIDEVIAEPLGGAHREPKQMAEKIKAAILMQLKKLQAKPITEVLDARYKKYMDIGK